MSYYWGGVWEQKLITLILFFLPSKVAKHSRSNLADVALAGLASKENFRKVNLRSVKSTEVMTNNSSLPFNKLMLIRIKGQKREKSTCACTTVCPIVKSVSGKRKFIDKDR